MRTGAERFVDKPHCVGRLNVAQPLPGEGTRARSSCFSRTHHHAGYYLMKDSLPGAARTTGGRHESCSERLVAARYTFFGTGHDHTPMADFAEVIAPLTEDQRRARPIIPAEGAC